MNQNASRSTFQIPRRTSFWTSNQLMIWDVRNIEIYLQKVSTLNETTKTTRRKRRKRNCNMVYEEERNTIRKRKRRRIFLHSINRLCKQQLWQNQVESSRAFLGFLLDKYHCHWNSPSLSMILMSRPGGLGCDCASKAHYLSFLVWGDKQSSSFHLQLACSQFPTGNPLSPHVSFLVTTSCSLKKLPLYFFLFHSFNL